MQEVIRLKPIPAVRPAVPRDPGNGKALKYVRGLIWAYFVLLIFEGTLRKWILPQFSDVLLVIRDPVVIAIYFLAFRARVFPRNGWVFSLTVIALLSLAASVLALWPYLPPSRIVLVSGFGFRCNFLHLPLIFIIGRVLDVEDVKKLGWWILLGMLPMSLLMALQFNGSPDSFVNRGAGLGESFQIGAGGGKIRPAGTFSFVTGVISYAALAAAYILYGALRRGVYRNWLLYSAGFALIVAIGVSGSRSALLAVLVVISSMLVIILVRPNAINRFGRSLLLMAMAVVVASQLPIFKEGVQVLSNRFSDAAEAEDKSIAGGLLYRVVGGFTEGLKLLPHAPIGGYGLGIGTNGGAKFLTGQNTFLLAEGEWGRIILESGPILGLAFLIWRTILTISLGLFSFRQLKSGQILTIMLYCAGFLSILTGQFGQPTNLGFAVSICGLILATANKNDKDSETAALEPARPARPQMARRSPYAEQLHHSSAAPRDPDDSPDW